MKDLEIIQIDVLDKGFVRLVDYMGDDNAIVQAARVSYGQGTKTKREDRNLIRYLMRNRHTSPFEMVEFKFHCKMPIFIARQWVRHRTANLNEHSGRYSEMPEECYVPELQRLQYQSQINKQGSKGQQIEDANNIQISMKNEQEVLFSNYHQYLDQDLARETARINLPLSTYTQWYWKMDLHNLFHFLSLRMNKHAQYEIQQYGKAIFSIIKQVVPISCEAFEDYRLNSCCFSGPEMIILKQIINKNIKELCEDSNLSKREIKEFRQKLNI